MNGDECGSWPEFQSGHLFSFVCASPLHVVVEVEVRLWGKATILGE